MRSDALKRHIRTHKDIVDMTDEEAREELRERQKLYEQRVERVKKITQISREENIPIERCRDLMTPGWSPKSEKDTRQEMILHKQEYLEKIELGKEVAACIAEEDIPEDSLSIDHKEALELYQKQMPRVSVQDVQLKPWQQQLLDIIMVPAEREIIWIIGKDGNEGKTWFQKYVQARFGFARVTRFDIKNKSRDILHALKKFPLTTIDIFFFNEARARDSKNCCYTVLEDIKDGSATASKFQSQVINFKTPNVVVVFSNDMPNWGELSMDRWKPFRIENNELVIHKDNDRV